MNGPNEYFLLIQFLSNNLFYSSSKRYKQKMKETPGKTENSQASHFSLFCSSEDPALHGSPSRQPWTPHLRLQILEHPE